MKLTEEQKQIIEKKIFGYKCNMCYSEGITFDPNTFIINPSTHSPNIIMSTCKRCNHIMLWNLDFILRDEQQ